jgi:hypothetical protein
LPLRVVANPTPGFFAASTCNHPQPRRNHIEFNGWHRPSQNVWRVCGRRRWFARPAEWAITSPCSRRLLESGVAAPAPAKVSNVVLRREFRVQKGQQVLAKSLRRKAELDCRPKSCRRRRSHPTPTGRTRCEPSCQSFRHPLHQLNPATRSSSSMPRFSACGTRIARRNASARRLTLSATNRIAAHCDRYPRHDRSPRRPRVHEVRASTSGLVPGSLCPRAPSCLRMSLRNSREGPHRPRSAPSPLRTSGAACCVVRRTTDAVHGAGGHTEPAARDGHVLRGQGPAELAALAPSPLSCSRRGRGA